MPDLDTLIAKLMAEFSQSGISELNLRQGDLEIYLSSAPDGGIASQHRSRPTAPQPIPANPGPVAAMPAPSLAKPETGSVSDLPAGARIITAPNLGTFYRAPKPGAAYYVEVGASVAEGEELCLIEVMKLFTAVRSDAAGRLHSVLAEDGSMVEAGQPLFALVND